MQPATTVQIHGEEARQFISGLADNIGLENIRAARIIRAAVAARTRSCFLQSWVRFSCPYIRLAPFVCQGFLLKVFYAYFTCLIVPSLDSGFRNSRQKVRSTRGSVKDLSNLPAFSSWRRFRMYFWLCCHTWQYPWDACMLSFQTVVCALLITNMSIYLIS